MSRYAIVSLVSGVLFAMMDGLIHANPFAQRLYAFYKPLARTSVNAAAGIGIDVGYGFALAGIFLILRSALPGQSGLSKGISFAVLVWFLRVVMGVFSSWMTFNIPFVTLLYQLFMGFVEMLVLGVLYGLTLRPSH